MTVAYKTAQLDERAKRDMINQKNSLLIPGASNGGMRVDLMCNSWDSPTFDGRRQVLDQPHPTPARPAYKLSA